MFFLNKQVFKILIVSVLISSQLIAQSVDSLLWEQIAKETVIQSTRVGGVHPIPHTNISQEALKKYYHSQDVPQLLQQIPSLVANSDAGAGVGYTGMRIRGSDQTRINVTLNGIPLNDAEGQGVFWVNLPDLATSASEIQVQRGVGSSTNGAGAFGATINFDMNRTEKEPFGEISSTLGSFDTYKTSLRAGTGLMQNGFFATARLSHIQSDGWVDRAASNMDAYHVHLGHIGKKQSITAHILSGKEKTYQAWYGLPVQYKDVDALINFNPAGTEKADAPYKNETDNYRQSHYFLHYKRTLAHTLSLQLNGHYTKGGGYYEQYKAQKNIEDYGGTPFELNGETISTSDIIRQLWLDNDFYGSTWALRWKPAINPPVFRKGPEFLLGGALNQYKGEHFGAVIWAARIPDLPKNSRYYENDATKNDFNSYLKMTFFLNNGLTTFVDAQVRQVAYTFEGFNRALENVEQKANFTFFNPKIGMNYTLNSNTSLYAFAGIANREPNRDDFTQSSPTSRPKAERLLDLETGYRFEKNEFSFSANAFFMDYKNQLVLDGRINDVGAYIRTNVADSYRAGIELESSAAITERFTLSGNIALSKNKAQEFIQFVDNWDTWEQEEERFANTDLAFSPALIGGATTSYRFFSQAAPLDVSLVGKYVGKQYLDNSQRENVALDGFFTADLNIRYVLPSVYGKNRLELLASIINLPGQHYIPNGWAYRYKTATFDPTETDSYSRRESGDTFTQIGLFPQAGRQFYLTANLRF